MHIHFKNILIGSATIGALAFGTAALAQAADASAPETVYVHPDTVYTHPLQASEQDRRITSELVSLLAHDHDLAGDNIGVRTVNGVVHLVGRVSTPARVYRVVELARQIAGVRAIDDHALDA